MLRIDVNHRDIDVLCIGQRTRGETQDGEMVEVPVDGPGILGVTHTTRFSWKHALALTRSIEEALALGWDPLTFVNKKDREAFVDNGFRAERFAKEIPQLAEIFYPEGT